LSAQASVVAHCLAVAASSTSSRPQTQQRTSVSVAHVYPDVMVVQIFARLFVQLNHGLPRVCEQWQEMLMITALNHVHPLCMVALLFRCIKKVITILGQVTESGLTDIRVRRGPSSVWFGISYTVSAVNPQLCPAGRLGRQPTRCRCDSAPPHFTLERAICPQRPSGVWLISTTMYFSSLEVTSFACVCVLRTLFPYICRTRSLVCAASFKARRGTVALCFASVIPSVSP
jgi:hypothetical protein